MSPPPSPRLGDSRTAVPKITEIKKIKPTGVSGPLRVTPLLLVKKSLAFKNSESHALHNGPWRARKSAAANESQSADRDSWPHFMGVSLPIDRFGPIGRPPVQADTRFSEKPGPH